MAMSSDFFEIFLPYPVPVTPSEFDIFIGLFVSDSGTGNCPLEGGGSVTVCLPLVTIGDDCLLDILAAEVVAMAVPGLDLPAERGLSGKVVLRFGGVSCGKSGGMIGWGGGRTRGLGELGLDVGPTVRPLEDKARTEEGEDVAEGVGLLQVGVDGLEEGCRMTGEVGVDGLEFWDGLVVDEERAVVVVVDGRVLEGVEGREVAVDEERLVGVDGLM